MKINAWACFSAKGRGSLFLFEENLVKEIYLTILEDHLLPYATKQFPNGFVFQDDNDPKHRAKVVEAWKKEQNVSTLYWPPNSPDLNPMENLWAIWNREVQKRQPTTKEALKKVVREEWAKIPVVF